MKRKFQNFISLFPVQLFFLHLRKNHLQVLIWVLLGLLLTGAVANKFGIKYLFLDPEYLGSVNFGSFLFMGAAYGAFLMTWNITSYLLNSFRFPFLASLGRPFIKFCFNNSIIPLAFMALYFGTFIRFQSYNEFATEIDIIIFCLGFVSGFCLTIFLTFVYFVLTNKNVFKFIKNEKPLAPQGMLDYASDRQTAKSGYHYSPYIINRVQFYLTERIKWRRIRRVEHYPPEVLQKVFRQHHINALMLQVVFILSLFTLALLIDHEWFRIPAGASIFILFALLISVAGALKYWLRNWSILALIVFLMIINAATSNERLKYQNKAYGMSYEKGRTPYTHEKFNEIASIENYNEDVRNTLEILEKWKTKHEKLGIEKPKMVLLGSSGGGMRAALWTTRVIQQLDSVTNGQLFENTVLMSGASGGMLGAAYMREVYLQSKLNPFLHNIQDTAHLEEMSRDLQNAIAFTIVVNDIFLPWMKFEDEGNKYQKDRGYIFEKQLIDNTDSLFSKRIKDYKEDEKNAIVPMMFFTPVVVNDVRRMVISPQGVSYMMKPANGFTKANKIEIDAVDFGRMFVDQDAYNLRLTTALRMNATYPYILPNVNLPSTPVVEVMDAGWRDNYGSEASFRFMNVFKDWIKENTSGVIVVQIRGAEKIEPLEIKKQGAIGKIFSPIGLASHQMEIQDFNQDARLNMLYDVLGEDMVHPVYFVYEPQDEKQRASMSWHLTTREKDDILRAIRISKNQTSLATVKALLESQGNYIKDGKLLSTESRNEIIELKD